MTHLRWHTSDDTPQMTHLRWHTSDGTPQMAHLRVLYNTVHLTGIYIYLQKYCCIWQLARITAPDCSVLSDHVTLYHALEEECVALLASKSNHFSPLKFMWTGLSLYEISPHERSPIRSIFRKYSKASTANVIKRSETFIFVIVVWNESIQRGGGKWGKSWQSVTQNCTNQWGFIKKSVCGYGRHKYTLLYWALLFFLL